MVVHDHIPKDLPELYEVHDYHHAAAILVLGAAAKFWLHERAPAAANFR